MISLDYIFKDHCILQKNKPIRIWGRSDEAAPLFLSIENPNGDPVSSLYYRREAFQKEDLSFSVEFPALSDEGPFQLRLEKNAETVVLLTDVLFGEVFLAGGQSNMEYELYKDAEFEEIKNQLSSRIRYYQIPKKAYKDDTYEDDLQSSAWLDKESALFTNISAVAYYFASFLEKKLSCAVGIIGCNWGGTSASAWQDEESLLSHPQTAVYVSEYQEILKSKTLEQHEKDRQDYLAYQAQWQPKADAFYAKNPHGSWDALIEYAGECRWPGPMGPKHEFRPCGLYETMFQTILPYSMAGVLFYQGESDDHKPHAYQTLFTSLIHAWRRDLQDQELPFLFVQLPIHRYVNEGETDKWCYIREAQDQVYKTVPATGMAVCFELGEFDNIHPTHKKEVGRRLYLQALTHIYHIINPAEAQGPFFSNAVLAQKETGIVSVTFSNAEDGFSYKNEPSDIEGFALSEDGIHFYPAAVMDLQKNRIQIICEKTPHPKYVQYLQYDYFDHVNLFGTNGLPAAPFISQSIDYH